MALSLDPDLRPVLDLARQWDELDRLAERAKARVDARIADLVFERDELAPKTFNARLADLVAERAAAVRDAEAQGAELLARMRALIGAATAPNDVPAPGPLAASKAAADDEDPSDEDDEEGQEGDPPESDATRPWPDSAPAMVLRGLAGLHRPLPRRAAAV